MPLNFGLFKEMPQAADPDDTGDIPSRFIPPALHSNFCLKFYLGYWKVLGAISDLLATTQDILSVANVRSILNGNEDADFYFQKGGRVEYAFDSITHSTKSQSPLGDNTFDVDLFGHGDEDDKVWTSLPTCVNDLEFQLVRRLIGLEALNGTENSQWGPYYTTDDLQG